MKVRFHIHEAAQRCGLNEEILLRFIQAEWLVPVDTELRILDEEDIARARFIEELRRDFGVNDEAVPLILHLVDQLNRMHAEISKL